MDNDGRNNVNSEETNKGFRYAALSLTGLHARFSQPQAARMALCEAVAMAQEADDHNCLLHALNWSLRLERVFLYTYLG